MTINITVYPNLDPRIIIVDVPQVSASVQDIVNAIRIWEDNEENMSYEKLIDAAGKEDLGGGVSVGITATLQNAQLRFAARPDPLIVGTATSNDSEGETLTDTGADFVAEGVYAGCTAFNLTSGALETVISVSTNSVKTFTLQAGSRQDWQIGDSYKIYPNELCNITGGNLVAVDDIGNNIDPVFQAPNINVVRSSSSSATTSDLEAIQYSSYQNAVWVDINGSAEGTLYPFGTRETPVNNLRDAVQIAEERGLNTLQILKSMTLDSGNDLNGYTIVGASHVATEITIEDSAQTSNVIIKNAAVQGILDGGTTLEGCVVKDISYVNGHIHNCGLEGTITLGGGEDAYLGNCSQSGIAQPIIDMGSSGQNLSLVEFSGSLKLKNSTSAVNIMDCALSAGNLTLDPTITAGIIRVSGVGQLTNNGTPTSLVTDGLMSKQTISEAVWDESVDNHTIAGSSGNVLRNLAFDGTVHVHAGSGNSGTAYPNGTNSQPVDNLADAKVIADDLDLNSFHVHGDFTLGQDYINWNFLGSTGPLSDSIDFGGYDVTGTMFKNLTLTGDMTGQVVARECQLDGTTTPVTGFNGSATDCFILGDLEVATGGVIILKGCSGSGTNGATVDTGGAGTVVTCANLTSTWTFTNAAFGVPFPTVLVAEFLSGTVTLDSSCVGGIIQLGGLVNTIDNSGPACVVNRDAQLQASPQAYAGAVWVDVDNGEAGTLYPLGTSAQPVNNFADAKAIADNLTIKAFNVAGQLTLSEDLEGYRLTGLRGVALDILDCDSISLNGCIIKNFAVTGEATGLVDYETCRIFDFSGLSGSAVGTALAGTVTLGAPGTTFQMVSGVYADGPTIIDFVGPGRIFQSEAIANVSFRNLQSGAPFNSFLQTGATWGNVTLESSCTGGIAVIQGDYLFTDNSAGTFVIDETKEGRHGSGNWEGAGAAGDIANAVWDEARADHTTAGTYGATDEWAGSIDLSAVADAVWEEPADEHLNDNTMGKKQSISTDGVKGTPFDPQGVLK